MLFFLTYKHKRWRPDRWNAKLSSFVCEENVFHWYQTGLRSPTCCDSPMTLSSRFLNVLYFTGWFYYLDFTTWRRLEAALLFVGIVELYPPWWWKSFVFFLFSCYAEKRVCRVKKTIFNRLRLHSHLQTAEAEKSFSLTFRKAVSFRSTRPHKGYDWKDVSLTLTESVQLLFFFSGAAIRPSCRLIIMQKRRRRTCLVMLQIPSKDDRRRRDVWTDTSVGGGRLKTLLGPSALDTATRTGGKLLRHTWDPAHTH